jgi:PAS domain S-box-containing protein
MSKRDRHLKQRLNELFSPAADEAPPAVPAPEPSVQARRAARTGAAAAAAPIDLPYLTAVINQLPLPAYIKDREHTWVALNAAFAQLLGQTPAALVGRTDKEQADEIWQLDDRVLESGREEISQETSTLPDGTLHTRRTRRTPVQSDDRTVRYVMGVVEDLPSQASSAQPQVQDSAETFHAALDAVPSPVIISRIADDVILYANQAFSTFTGLPPAQLLGQRAISFYADPADRERVVQGVRQQGELHGFEVRMRRADGSVFWVSLSIRRLKFNAEACVITTLEDIADRKQAEQELAKFKLGIDRAYFSVMITATDGSIVYVNPAFTKTYGYTADEAIGQKPSLLKSGAVTPNQYTRFWNKLLSGEVVTGEIINKTKDGRLIPVETNNSPILDESGQLMGFISMQSDISARKQAEEDLVTRNRQLATFNRVGQELAQLVTPQEVVEHVYTAIGEVFDNRNLYIALYDERKQEISFPVYTMDGERRTVAGRPFGNGITEHVLRTKKALWIPRDVPQFAASIGVASIGRSSQCYLGVPLLSGDKALGVIAVQDYEQEAIYTTADVELLSAIAAQTAAALENVRLYAAESRRAVQLQTAAEISTAAGTVLNIDELLPVVVDLIQQRFNLYYVGLFLVDELQHNAVLRAGTGEVGRRMLERRHQLPLDDHSMIGWCIRQRVPRIALDVGEDAVRFNNPDLPDTHSELALPLVSRGEVVGAMTVQSTEVAAFSEQDIAILQTMSDQVATAIANAQLFEEAGQARRQAEAHLRETQFLQSVGQTVSSSLDLSFVMDLVMNALQDELGFTHNALYLVDRKAGTVTTPRAAGSAAQLLGLTRSLEQLRGDILLDILEKGKIDVIDGWDDRLDREIYESQGHAELVRAFVPLRLRRESIGLLEVGYRRTERARITPDEVRLLGGLADQIAIAVDNARLFNESQQRVTELAVVNEISRTLTVTQDLQQLFATIHQQVGRLYDATNFYIATYDGGEEWSLDYQFEHGQLLPSARHKLGGGFTSHILLTRESILIRSQLENAAFHDRHDLPHIGEIARSWMGVPLIVGGSIIGVMGIQSYEQEGVYNQQDMALFSTIATQAATAIQNARLFQQARLRAAELAALNELSQTLAAQLNVRQVLEEVWHGVSRLLDTTNFYIALYDRERQEISFPINASESVLDKEIEVMPADQGLTGYIIRTRQPLLISEDTDRRVKELGLENIGGTSQSYLGVPVMLGDNVLGVMAIQSYDRARLYGEHDQSLMTAIAGQAAIALQNAQLFEEARTRAEELSLLNDIGQQLSAALSLDELYRTTHQQVGRLFDTTSFFIGTYEPGSDHWQMAYRIEDGQPAEPGPRSLKAGFGSYMITTQKPLLINTAQELDNFIEANHITRLGPSAKAWLGVPLIAAGQVVGVMAVQNYHRENVYSSRDLALFSAIANQVAIAIQNARLFEETQQRSTELTTLNQIISSASQTLDLRTLLDTVLQQTLDVFGFDGGLITMFNESRGKLERVVRTGLPGRIPDDPAEGLENSLCNYVFESKAPLAIEDFRQGAPIDVQGEIEAGYYSYIGVPLEARGRMLGTWCGFRKMTGAFGANTLALLLTISRQVSSAIDNARLFTQTQTTLAETAQLYAASQHLTAATNLQEAVVAMAEGIPIADINRVALWLFERDKTDRVSAAIVSAGWYSGHGVPVMPTGTRLPVEVIRALPQVQTTEPLFSNDLQTDRRIDPSTAAVLQQQQIGAIAILPLWSAGLQIGALLLEAEGPHTFTDAEIRPYTSLSQQLATTIYNQQLLEQVQRTAQREQTLRELTARVRSSTDPDAIARTAVRELGIALGRQTFIRLGAAEQLSRPPHGTQTEEPASGNGHATSLEGGQ